MTGLRLLLIVVGTSAISAQVQAPDSTVPAFDVVWIKLNHSGERPSMRSSPGGRTTATNQTLKSLIQWAYDVQGYQISGGPKWIDSVGYDIEATPKVALNPGPDTIRYFRQMVQEMLAARFNLVLQHTTKELPAYALVVGKGGARLKEREKPANPTDMRMSGGRGVMAGQQALIWLVAQSLSNLLGRPVQDETGLNGYYDFRLEWTPDESEPSRTLDGVGTLTPRDHDGPSIFTAIQEQLGLKLVARKLPVEVLVIDRVESPSEN